MIRSVSIFALAAAISAGQSSIPLVSSILPYPFSQARFFFALLVAVGIGLTTKGDHNRASLNLAITLAITCAALAIHALIFGVEPIKSHFIIDVSFLAAFGFAATLLLRHEADLRIFCSALILIAVPLAVAWQLQDPDNIKGFTVVTYYRAEFFAFAASLYFAIKGVRIAWLAAAAFLFATLDSTSRAAVIFAPISVAYLCFTLASRIPVLQRPYRRSALMPLALLIVVAGLFIPTRSATVASRLNTGASQEAAGAVLSPQPGLSHERDGVQPPISASDQPTQATQLPPEKARVASAGPLEDGSKQLLPLADRKVDGITKTNLFTFSDGTQRVRLAIKAIELFKESPIKGQGIGRYSIHLPSSTSDGFDEYRYPHNASLEVLYSTGIIGFGIYGACLAGFMIALSRKIIENPDAAPIACGAVFALITSHFAGDFNDLRMFWILVIAAYAATSAPASPSVELS